MVTAVIKSFSVLIQTPTDIVLMNKLFRVNSIIEENLNNDNLVLKDALLQLSSYILINKVSGVVSLPSIIYHHLTNIIMGLIATKVDIVGPTEYSAILQALQIDVEIKYLSPGT